MQPNAGAPLLPGMRNRPVPFMRQHAWPCKNIRRTHGSTEPRRCARMQRPDQA